MSLTKLEVLNLDQPIWSYEIYKTALKLEFLNYHMNTQPLTCGTRVLADPTRQRDKNRGGGICWHGGGLAHRRRGLRRHQSYLHDPRDERNRLVQVARPKT